MLRDKLGTKATKTLDLAIQSDKEYRIALEKTNERQNRYYEKEMPSILEVISTISSFVPFFVSFSLSYCATS